MSQPRDDPTSGEHRHSRSYYEIEWSAEEKKDIYGVEWSEPIHDRNMLDRVALLFGLVVTFVGIGPI